MITFFQSFPLKGKTVSSSTKNIYTLKGQCTSTYLPKNVSPSNFEVHQKQK